MALRNCSRGRSRMYTYRKKGVRIWSEKNGSGFLWPNLDCFVPHAVLRYTLQHYCMRYGFPQKYEYFKGVIISCFQKNVQFSENQKDGTAPQGMLSSDQPERIIFRPVGPARGEGIVIPFRTNAWKPPYLMESRLFSLPFVEWKSCCVWDRPKPIVGQ